MKRGQIEISMEVYFDDIQKNNGKLLKALQKDFTVIAIDTDPSRSILIFTALNPGFDEVKIGEYTPHYEVHFCYIPKKDDYEVKIGRKYSVKERYYEDKNYELTWEDEDGNN